MQKRVSGAGTMLVNQSLSSLLSTALFGLPSLVTTSRFFATFLLIWFIQNCWPSWELARVQQYGRYALATHSNGLQSTPPAPQGCLYAQALVERKLLALSSTRSCDLPYASILHLASSSPMR